MALEVPEGVAEPAVYVRHHREHRPPFREVLAASDAAPPEELDVGRFRREVTP